MHDVDRDVSTHPTLKAASWVLSSSAELSLSHSLLSSTTYLIFRSHNCSLNLAPHQLIFTNQSPIRSQPAVQFLPQVPKLPRVPLPLHARARPRVQDVNRVRPPPACVTACYRT